MPEAASSLKRRALRAVACGGALALIVASTLGCDALPDRLRRDKASPTSDSMGAAASPTVGTTQPASDLAGDNTTFGPDAYTLSGRLVDAVTGLPVTDAGVSLLERDRRTISAPDGRFRFDGLEPGAATVVFGPVPDYVARSLDVRIVEEGLDIGVTPLLPAAPPTLIVPEFGGVVVACDGTELLFAKNAVPGATAVSATCLAQPREYPAPAPAGRLALAVLDLAPQQLAPSPAAELTVALPSQPRFSDGIPLDLLRLDLDRLVWVPTGTLAVEPGGVQASGTIEALGTYMVAAPPLGAELGSHATGPVVQQFQLGAAADGPPADVFPTGTIVVYAVYDYANMADTPVTTRAFGEGGSVLFQSTRRYSGRGTDSVPMTNGSAAWPPGEYNATIYVGEPATNAYSVAWRVAAAPTVEPPTPTLPSVPGERTSGGVPTRASGAAVPSGCKIPSGWYAYVVQPGDTLSSLARRTGTTVARLQNANCLSSASLYAGSVIYLPQPPARVDEPAATTPPYATSRPTIVPPAPTRASTPVATYPPQPTAVAPGMPTTWYTPPATSVYPPAPTQAPPTLPPAPTGVQPTEPPIPTQVPPTSAPPPTSVAPTDAPAPTVMPPPETVVPTTQAPVPRGDGVTGRVVGARRGLLDLR